MCSKQTEKFPTQEREYPDTFPTETLSTRLTIKGEELRAPNSPLEAFHIQSDLDQIEHS